MSRLFTFGCSYTNYRWSTWADCLAPEFDYFENWGQSGGGNHYIFNSLMEADQRHKFGKNDTVIVCWSTFMRDDWYIEGRWNTVGNMYTTPVYNENYLKTHVDERGYVIRDFALIKGAKALLENRVGVDWNFLSLSNLKLGTRCETAPGEPYDVMKLYSDVLNSILPSYQEVLYPTGFPNRVDPHPSPAEHLAYLDVVLPGWVTKSETRVKMHEESVNLNKDPRKSGMTKVTRL
jgi:hypothetical protein